LIPPNRYHLQNVQRSGEFPEHPSFFLADINPSQSSQLLVHCSGHVLENGKVHGLDELPFAHGTCTSIFRGYFGEARVAIKMWRGASMSKPNRQKFVEVRNAMNVVSLSQYPHPQQRLSKELDNWKRLQHFNISPFIGVVSGFGHLPALLLPYYQNGHVNDYLAKNPSANILHLVRTSSADSKTREPTLKFDILQLGGLANALSYMHNLSPPLAHGDVKGVSTFTCSETRHLQPFIRSPMSLSPTREMPASVISA